MHINPRSLLQLTVSKDPRTWLILLAICEKNIVRYFLLIISTSIPVIGQQLSLVILHSAYLLLIAQLFLQRKIGITARELLVMSFVTSAIIFSTMLYPTNARYIFNPNNFWETLFPCVRFFIVGMAFTADKKTMDMVGKASCYAIVVEALFVTLYMMPRGLMGTDDMSRSYQLLPNVLLAINYAISKKSIISSAISALGSVYLLAMGSRGPIAVLLVYFILRVVQYSSTKKPVKVAYLTIIILAGLIFLNSSLYTSILLWFKSLFEQIGVSTRIIDLLIKQEAVSHTSGRDAIYSLLLEKLAERPLLGYGIYGEWQWVGWSAHNLFLEILFHFGIPLGILIMFWIVYTIFGAYFQTPNRYAKEFILIWACHVFIRGFFGGAYLDKNMAITIGFCLRELSRLKSYHRGYYIQKGEQYD